MGRRDPAWYVSRNPGILWNHVIPFTWTSSKRRYQLSPVEVLARRGDWWLASFAVHRGDLCTHAILSFVDCIFVDCIFDAKLQVNGVSYG